MLGAAGGGALKRERDVGIVARSCKNLKCQALQKSNVPGLANNYPARSSKNLTLSSSTSCQLLLTGLAGSSTSTGLISWERRAAVKQKCDVDIVARSYVS